MNFQRTLKFARHFATLKLCQCLQRGPQAVAQAFHSAHDVKPGACCVLIQEISLVVDKPC